MKKKCFLLFVVVMGIYLTACPTETPKEKEKEPPELHFHRDLQNFYFKKSGDVLCFDVDTLTFIEKDSGNKQTLPLKGLIGDVSETAAIKNEVTYFFSEDHTKDYIIANGDSLEEINILKYTGRVDDWDWELLFDDPRIPPELHFHGRLQDTSWGHKKHYVDRLYFYKNTLTVEGLRYGRIQRFGLKGLKGDVSDGAAKDAEVTYFFSEDHTKDYIVVKDHAILEISSSIEDLFARDSYNTVAPSEWIYNLWWQY